MYRREIEISFTQKIKEVENRFSGDQESVAKRFQADVLKLEHHYQSELKALSESHIEQKLRWEAQIQEAIENAEEQRRMTAEATEQERESQNQEWTKERYELESLHKAEMEQLVMKNQQLQNELDDFISKAQTKEIELSRQLNDLHNRLQGSLETKDKLLALSEEKALETELLLNQTVEDFKQERDELLSCQSELEAKYNEMLSISERQVTERIELLTERDDLKMKIEELEMLLKQASVDFELERKELQEHSSLLEKKLKDNVENDREELIAERDELKIRIKELEMELNQVLSFEEKAKKEELKESNEINTFMEELLNTRECVSFSGGEQKTCSASPQICNDVILADSSNQEPVCLSPFLVEEEVDIETMTEAVDAVEEGHENIKNADYEFDEKVPAANDDQGDNMQEIKTDATENKHEKANGFGEECHNKVVAVPEDYQIGNSSLEDVSCCLGMEIGHEDPKSTSCDGHNPGSPVPDENHSDIDSKNEAVSPEMPCEAASSLEAFEGVDADEDATDGENKVALESCEENKPQDVPALVNKSSSHEDEPCHETAVDPSVLEETGDPDELSLADAEVNCLPNKSYDHSQEVELLSDSDCEYLTAEIKDECAHDSQETLDEDADCEDRECSLLKLQALYNTAKEENILLHDKISLLQQKSEILENLLAHSNEKIKTGHIVLEDNYTLKVKILLLMEHVKELEIKALKMTDLQIKYEDCMCENAKLKDQNSELEKRVWSLESRMNIFQDFQGQQIALVDEICWVREENSKLSELFSELEKQSEILLAVHPVARQSESPTEESLLDLTSQLEVKVQSETDLEGSCEVFEKHNTKLRKAITELQDKSLALNETTQAHR